MPASTKKKAHKTPPQKNPLQIPSYSYYDDASSGHKTLLPGDLKLRRILPTAVILLELGTIVEARAEDRRPTDPVARVPRPRLSIHDQALQATKDAMNDPTLRKGDIVSTGQGLVIFQGKPDIERGEKDFAPVRREK